LDVVIVTDHNVWVSGKDGYQKRGDKRVLLLVGEEIHDRTRKPQKNHLMVFGMDRELESLASSPQSLIDMVDREGGLSFIAHPIDPPAPKFGEEDLSWIDWDVKNFTGIELWNAMSEFKSHLTSKLQAIFYAYNPARIAYGPFPEAVQIWNRLHDAGHRVVAVGGSDAHAMIGKMGPLTRVLFPYEFHFKSINTHILIETPLIGEYSHDRKLVFQALKHGHCFIGYDLPASTKGFRFKATSGDNIAIMGDDLSFKQGIMLDIELPKKAECCLLKDGDIIKDWHNLHSMSYEVNEAGVYRVEAYTRYLGHRRSWIISNPIYIN
jgi:hypothetical protein